MRRQRTPGVDEMPGVFYVDGMGKQVDRNKPIVRRTRSDYPGGRKSFLETIPGLEDQLLEVVTHPDNKDKPVEAIARELGIPARSVWKYIRHLQRNPEGITEHQALKDHALLQMLEQAIAKGMGFLLDDVNMANMPARDLAWMVAVFFDKRQALLQSPAGLIDEEEMVSIDQMLPVVFDEMQRRGKPLPDHTE